MTLEEVQVAAVMRLPLTLSSPAALCGAGQGGVGAKKAGEAIRQQCVKAGTEGCWAGARKQAER